MFLEFEAVAPWYLRRAIVNFFLWQQGKLSSGQPTWTTTLLWVPRIIPAGRSRLSYWRIWVPYLIGMCTFMPLLARLILFCGWMQNALLLSFQAIIERRILKSMRNEMILWVCQQKARCWSRPDHHSSVKLGCNFFFDSALWHWRCSAEILNGWRCGASHGPWGDGSSYLRCCQWSRCCPSLWVLT